MDAKVVKNAKNKCYTVRFRGFEILIIDTKKKIKVKYTTDPWIMDQSGQNSFVFWEIVCLLKIVLNWKIFKYDTFDDPNEKDDNYTR